MNENTSRAFTASEDFINRQVTVTIDRPLGSKHPKYGFVYPVNYGYISGTLSPDGEELDAYVLGVDELLTEFVGVCIAVIHRTDDNDDKLIVVPDGTNLSDEQIKLATNFQEQYFTSLILRTTTK